LKPLENSTLAPGQRVAPHTGAWIETFAQQIDYNLPQVAPHTGAWIETVVGYLPVLQTPVAPHTGAWIETRNFSIEKPERLGRAPHGRVD